MLCFLRFELFIDVLPLELIDHISIGFEVDGVSPGIRRTFLTFHCFVVARHLLIVRPELRLFKKQAQRRGFWNVYLLWPKGLMGGGSKLGSKQLMFGTHFWDKMCWCSCATCQDDQTNHLSL